MPRSVDEAEEVLLLPRLDTRDVKGLQTCLSLLVAVQPGGLDGPVWPSQKRTPLASGPGGLLRHFFFP